MIINIMNHDLNFRIENPGFVFRITCERLPKWELILIEDAYTKEFVNKIRTSVEKYIKTFDVTLK